MDIDERLGKLAVRTDALAQSVELIASMHKDNEKRIERMAQGNARLESLVTEIAEGTARLLRVAEVHEQRIRRLEEK